MTKAGDRIIAGAQEALAIVNGEATIDNITIEGKRFQLGQGVRDSDQPPMQANGVICKLELPDHAEDGPIHVQWDGHDAIETFFADEMTLADDVWMVA